MMNTMKCLIIIEKAPGNYSAFSPDVPGCGVTADTIEETLTEMKSALAFHLVALDEIPQPKGLLHYINSGEMEFEKGSLFTELEIETRAAA
jgi:predicted RNase H-like HicB family nuclease